MKLMLQSLFKFINGQTTNLNQHKIICDDVVMVGNGGITKGSFNISLEGEGIKIKTVFILDFINGYFTRLCTLIGHPFIQRFFDFGFSVKPAVLLTGTKDKHQEGHYHLFHRVKGRVTGFFTNTTNRY